MNNIIVTIMPMQPVCLLRQWPDIKLSVHTFSDAVYQIPAVSMPCLIHTHTHYILSRQTISQGWPHTHTHIIRHGHQTATHQLPNTGNHMYNACVPSQYTTLPKRNRYRLKRAFLDSRIILWSSSLGQSWNTTLISPTHTLGIPASFSPPQNPVSEGKHESVEPNQLTLTKC